MVQGRNFSADTAALNWTMLQALNYSTCQLKRLMRVAQIESRM